MTGKASLPVFLFEQYLYFMFFKLCTKGLINNSVIRTPAFSAGTCKMITNKKGRYLAGSL